jgi:hypothetical protein
MTAVYVPLSPARSECAYEPLSPARSECAYEPLSPARSVVNLNKLYPFQKILYAIKNAPPIHTHPLTEHKSVMGCPRCDYNKLQRPPQPRPQQRIDHWQNYCRHAIHNDRWRYVETLSAYDRLCMDIASNYCKNNKKTVFDIWLNRTKDNSNFIEVSKNKLEQIKKELKVQLVTLNNTREMCCQIFMTETNTRRQKETLKSVITAWRESCPTPLRKPNEPFNVPSDLFRVILKYDIQEDGYVRIKVSAPLARIHETYTSKGRKTPFDEHIVALREFGYPEWKLEQYIRRRKEQTLPTQSIAEALESTKIKTKTKQTSKLQKLKTKVK